MTDALTGDVVVDASVVADLLVGDDGPALRSRLLHARWHAPAHLGIEISSALRGLVLGGHLRRSRAREAILDLGDLDVTRWHPDPDFLARVQELWGLDDGVRRGVRRLRGGTRRQVRHPGPAAGPSQPEARRGLGRLTGTSRTARWGRGFRRAVATSRARSRACSTCLPTPRTPSSCAARVDT